MYSGVSRPPHCRPWGLMGLRVGASWALQAEGGAASRPPPTMRQVLPQPPAAATKTISGCRCMSSWGCTAAGSELNFSLWGREEQAGKGKTRKKGGDICVRFCFAQASTPAASISTVRNSPRGICWMNFVAGNMCIVYVLSTKPKFTCTNSLSTWEELFCACRPKSQAEAGHTQSHRCPEHRLCMHMRWHCLQNGAAAYGRCEGTESGWQHGS